MKHKKVVVMLTDEQIKQLAPVYKVAKEHRGEGVIIGQVWPDLGRIVVTWLTLDELAASAKTTKKTGGKKIPKGWWNDYKDPLEQA